MIAVSPRFMRTLVACGIFAAGQALLVSSSVPAPSDSSCTALREWARPFEGTSPTLDEVARFDRAHRRAIFNAVTPEVRATLWQEQLRRVERRTALTAQQRALIAKALTLTTPALYERDRTAMQAYRAFWATAETAFTEQTHKRALSDLGSVVETPRTHATSAWDRLTSAFHASAGTQACECNLSSGAIDCGGACGAGGGCTMWQGCGATGALDCNSLCR